MRLRVVVGLVGVLAVGCGRVAFTAAPPTGGPGIDAGIDAGATVRVDAAGTDAGAVPGFDAGDFPVADGGSFGVDAHVVSSVDAGTDASLGAYNVVFLTPLLPNANLGGLSGADATCAMYARMGGFGGTFVAWLSTSTVDAVDRLGSAEGWVRPDGLPVALTRADLVAGRLIYPPSVDYMGVRNPVGSSQFMTGTGLDARLSPGNACADWASSAGGTMRGGGCWDMPSISWMSRCWGSCDLAGRIACFQIDHASGPPRPTAISGRRIFTVYRPMFTETPDAACARGATSAGLTGSYGALVADSTGPAGDRFTLDWWPWVNTAGQLVAANREDLTSNGLWSAVLAATGGSVEFSMLRTGAPGVLAASDGHCMDYASMSGAQSATVSLVGYTAQHWFGGGTGMALCSEMTWFYCLER